MFEKSLAQIENEKEERRQKLLESAIKANESNNCFNLSEGNFNYHYELLNKENDNNQYEFKSRPLPIFDEPKIEVRPNLSQILREENTLKQFDQKDIDKTKMNELQGCNNVDSEIDYDDVLKQNNLNQELNKNKIEQVKLTKINATEAKKNIIQQNKELVSEFKKENLIMKNEKEKID